jgi:hypothetical protein
MTPYIVIFILSVYVQLENSRRMYFGYDPVMSFGLIILKLVVAQVCIRAVKPQMWSGWYQGSIKEKSFWHLQCLVYSITSGGVPKVKHTPIWFISGVLSAVADNVVSSRKLLCETTFSGIFIRVEVGHLKMWPIDLSTNATVSLC